MVIRSRYIFIFISYTLIAMAVLCLRHLYDFILPFLFSIIGAFLFSSLLFKKYRKLTYVFTFFYGLFLSMELASLYVTGKFIEVLTLANLREYNAVGRDVIYASLLIMISMILSCLFMKGKKELYCSPNIYILFIPIVVFYFMMDAAKPMTIFIDTCYQYSKQLFYRPNKKMALEQQKIYGKDWIYQNNNENVPDLRGKNIVTLFTEGFSLEVIDKFHNYSNLTPNVTKLLDRSLWFDNYFNHTAATFRGLRGQLSSSFQYTGGSFTGKRGYDAGFLSYSAKTVKDLTDTSLINIVSILQNKGYHVYFFSMRDERDHLNLYLKLMGFDKVFMANDFKSDGTDLTDKEMLSYLYELLKSGKLKEPFFLGVYTADTHVGCKSTGEKYMFNGKDDNDALNVYYNYDTAFGSFIEKFDGDADLFNRTALIFTADHAAYPTEQFLSTYKENRTDYMSKIPLAFYYKGVIPQRIDAKGKTSLDFAPTLLNMLRINDAHNYFLGCSLYDTFCALPFDNIYNVDDIFIYTDTLQKFSNSFKEIDMEIKKKIFDFYNLSETRVFEWNLK